MKEILIKNVTILTMDDENSRFFGWVLLKNGKIDALGEGEPPACSEVLDGEGGVLTPGLIDIHSHLGLYEDGLGFEGADGNEDTDPVTPQMRAIDAVNPMDHAFREALEAGVTAAGVSPGSANAIGGQIALIKTAGRRIDDMIVKAPLAMKFALGENPKSVYHDKDETPVTRMATAALIRDELYKGREYLSRKARAEVDDDHEEPDYDGKMEALLPVLAGKGARDFVFRAAHLEGVRPAPGHHPRNGGSSGRGPHRGGECPRGVRPVHDRPLQARDQKSDRRGARHSREGRHPDRHYGRPSGNSPAPAAGSGYARGPRRHG